ncbi:hypothetical protein DM794_20015 [Paenarthrobacter ureafaciens]|uniref:hypothetical protein n=1 Tax=Paenarthrobacter TaxID=1742992 RepID=UPI0015B9177C|nr:MULTISPECIES: hypothetical protein [Paenarthrobacter]BCW84102.1 hypothetical protein NicSoilE8_17750 [Arthrobacter sp. NicSoilE8]MEC3853959.1 hypothetical protein [Paenarthrobacter ureafaciens]NWL29315.1 hypothetical protein [Paenarthrobacter ureafaciens]QSZ54039.1 hypothetical protein AYX19_14280 [Paenarthrobacter ureafaciens]WOC62833.1 hypothetical protein RI444_09530 [Paenarthrobacter sp. AT5]
MNEFEASLIIKAGAEQLSTASADPRSEEAYAAVKANLSEALNHLATALENFESNTAAPTRSIGWLQDLRRVADDLVQKPD